MPDRLVWCWTDQRIESSLSGPQFLEVAGERTKRRKKRRKLKDEEKEGKEGLEDYNEGMRGQKSIRVR